jgi:hypothetical protein
MRASEIWDVPEIKGECQLLGTKLTFVVLSLHKPECIPVLMQNGQ